MIEKLRKLGNSKGIIINKTIQKHLDIKENDNLQIQLKKNKIIIKKEEEQK